MIKPVASHRALRFALVLTGLLCPASLVGAQIREVVIDVAPFTPAAVAGELFGLSSISGRVVHARIDATFVSADPGPWTLWANFALSTGVAGVDSQTEGWSGLGSFSTTVHTDALNGPIGPPPGQTFHVWFLEWVGGTPFELPGGGVGMQAVNGTFTELALTLFLCDCPSGPWADLEHALPGTHGAAQLTGSGNLCRGAPGALLLDGAPPGGSAFLIIGLSSLWQPFRGGLLIPAPDIVLPAQPLDANGQLELGFNFPIGVPAGVQLWFQAWLPDPGAPAGYAASNALQATVPSDC